jgi:hypothetical protein
MVAMQSKNSSTTARLDTIAAQSANFDLVNATSTATSAENSQVTSTALVSDSNNTYPASSNTLATNNSPQIYPPTP